MRKPSDAAHRAEVDMRVFGVLFVMLFGILFIMLFIMLFVMVLG